MVIPVQLAPQPHDVQIQRAGVGFGPVAAPDPLIQGIPVQRRAPVAHELLQQFKFVGRQVHRLAVPGHRMFPHIQHHVKGLHDVAAPGPPQHRFHPGQQFLHHKGLHDIVVSPPAQAFHPLPDGALGRNKDHRYPLGPQIVQQFVAIQPRQHDVQQRQVIVVFLDQVGGGAAVPRHRAVIPRPRQTHLDEPRDEVFVLHDQNVRHTPTPFLSPVYPTTALYPTCNKIAGKFTQFSLF